MKKKFVLVCFILAILIAACTQQKIVSGINPVKVSDLNSTTKIEVWDLFSEGEGPALLLENAADVEKIVTTLDRDIQVTPKTFCAPRYTMQFHLSDGSFVDIHYFCDGNDPFIRSDLDYFANEDYAVTQEFVLVMDEMLAQVKPDAVVVSEERVNEPPAELANPASVYCKEQGGSLEIRKDESGGEYGVCQFEDGSECEEWAYFRGECEPGG